MKKINSEKKSLPKKKTQGKGMGILTSVLFRNEYFLSEGINDGAIASKTLHLILSENENKWSGSIPSMC